MSEEEKLQEEMQKIIRLSRKIMESNYELRCVSPKDARITMLAIMKNLLTLKAIFHGRLEAKPDLFE